MCYKDSVQRYNENKLTIELERDNAPMFVKKYLYQKRSKGTGRNYYIALKDFFIWLIENNLVKENAISEFTQDSLNMIESADIDMYLDQRESGGMSPTTLATRKNIISSFFAYLVESPSSKREKNPVKGCSYKGIQNNNNLFAKLPSEDEINIMLEKIQRKKDEMVRERNIAIVKTLLGSGIRESELAGLELSDLFLEGTMPYITILGKGAYRETEKRMVFITKSVVDALNKWLEIRCTIDGIEDVNAVFVTKTRKRITEDTIKSLFKNYGGKITCHQLRHYYSTVMSKKVDIIFVSQNLGHKRVETTVNNYANGFYGVEELLSIM